MSGTTQTYWLKATAKAAGVGFEPAHQVTGQGCDGLLHDPCFSPLLTLTVVPGGIMIDY